MLRFGTYDDEERILVDRAEFLGLIEWGLEAHRALTVLSTLPNPLSKGVKNRLTEVNSILPKRYRNHFENYSSKAIAKGLREVFNV